jgi:hypothetical protein
MTEKKPPARKRPAHTSAPKAKAPPPEAASSPRPQPPEKQPQPDMNGIVLACETERWTGTPCARPAPGQSVTVRMSDGGEFTGIVCLTCRERFAHHGHEVAG